MSIFNRKARIKSYEIEDSVGTLIPGGWIHGNQQRDWQRRPERRAELEKKFTDPKEKKCVLLVFDKEHFNSKVPAIDRESAVTVRDLQSAYDTVDPVAGKDRTWVLAEPLPEGRWRVYEHPLILWFSEMHTAEPEEDIQNPFDKQNRCFTRTSLFMMQELTKSRFMDADVKITVQSVMQKVVKRQLATAGKGLAFAAVVCGLGVLGACVPIPGVLTLSINMAEKIAGGVLSEAGSLAFYSAMAPSTPSAKLSKAAMVALEARVRTIVKEDIDKELNDSQRLDKLAELIESHHRKSVGRNNAIL